MQYSATHQMVIYDLPDPSRVLTLIGDAKQLPNGLTAVPIELRNMQIMRHLGHPAISPIEYFYDWPSRFPHPRPNQLVTAAFKTLYPQNVDTSDMRCVDCETEYLSPTGWRRMDSYAGGKVAQYDPNTGAAEFVEPIGYYVSACDEMIRFKTSKGVDQKLSPGHRVLYARLNGELVVQSASAVMAAQLIQRQGFRGRFITTFKAPTTAGLALTDAELRVQIAVIADGYIPNNTTLTTVRLKKTRKKERLRAHLLAAEIKWTETEPEYLGYEGFTIFKFYAPRRDKLFTEYYWSANASQLSLIAEEVGYWDGSSRKAGATVFYSVEPQSIDFIQYAYAASGRTARVTWDHRTDGVRPCGQVYASAGADLVAMNGNTSDGTKIEPASIEPTTDGKMYCFEVPSSFLVFRRNGRIFMSGNTGKTLSSLWATDYLMRTNYIHRVLILSPLSTLDRVWEHEIKTSFHGRRTCTILHGDRERRLKRLAEPHDYYILNHDGLGVGTRRIKRVLELGPLVREIMLREDIDLCLIDELSAYKHATSDRYKVLQHMLAYKHSMWRWGLTGTPASKAPTDAWAQGRLIYGKDKRPESLETFRMRTMIQVSEFKWKSKPGADQVVAQWLQPAIRFTRKELGFPPLSYEVREVPMSAGQKVAYAQMKKTLQLVTEGGQQIDAVNEASLRTKLIQISCGAIYGEDHEVHYVDAAPRIGELMDIIEEAGGKLLVFAPLTSVINLIYERLRKELSCERVNGRISASARNVIFRDFQEKADPRVLICDPRTMAHGLNLTAASTIVWFGPTDSLELYEQANARIDGPEACGVVIQLSSTPVEREIYRRQQEKQALQGSILSLLREAA